MSRFTASPFHKPSPFEFPHGPLSPPDTNAEAVGPAQMPTPSVAGGHENRHPDVAPTPVPSLNLETPGARFRRVSSIAYHNSGIRESRERTPQPRSSIKSFIVVLPPASLIQEHGQLGHILSSGPHNRLSQGIIMPLFPTMYGQLSAIAREFNFPSTAGLCLYMQLTEDGITMTPRISEDSWQIVWSHTLDPSSPSTSRGPPLGGKIEFDIDYRQARWYSSWLSSLNRDHLEISVPVYPSAPHSVAHHRGESRTTIADTFDDDHATENNSVTPPRHSAPPITRHVPRKLSLVDRFDVASARSDSRPASRSALSPPEEQLATAQVLSPIVQEDEPKSARQVLDNKVRSWRASAVLKPSHLATTGQVSLEPANMPNNVSISDDAESPVAEELNFEDFDWSVTSAGPEDYDPLSPMSWDRVPSVHLANRLEGSVCLTPSDCTSFGPSDYTLPSPIPSFERLPSPDIAYRMFDDSPPTPMTATSWGAPLSYPPSPLSAYHASSVDIGDRMIFSRPVTPLTATSWGPSDRSWPSSPISEYDSRSVHLANRGEASRPITPSTATSWGAPLSYPPTPLEPFYVQTPDAGHRGFENSDDAFLQLWNARPWEHVWPYNRRTATEEESVTSHPWAHVWPYTQRQVREERAVSYRPWEHVWPYNNVHDSPTSSTGDRASRAGGRLTLNRPWNHVWPYNHNVVVEVEAPIAVHAPSRYPYLNIYPSVYPHLEIYPSIQHRVADSETSGYPHFYPDVQRKVALDKPSPSTQPVVVKLDPVYPVFNIYPAVYPGNLNELYPPTAPTKSAAIIVRIPPTYPSFDLYPSVYPYVEPYPSIPQKMVTTSMKVSRLHPRQAGEKPVTEFNMSVHVHRYPTFNLYPAVYPNFDMYPSIGGKSPSSDLPDNKSMSIYLSSSYPVFNIYPAVYPIFEIYPALPADYDISKSGGIGTRQSPATRTARKQVETTIALSRKATSIANMYTTGYPDFVLYPPISSDHEEYIDSMSNSVIRYPIFCLYPAVYPYFDLYPSISGQIEASRLVTVGKPVHYPVFNIYPAVYPHFDLYPLIAGQIEEQGLSMACEPVQYPVFNLYPAVYPHFDLYPVIAGQIEEQGLSMACEPVQYPVFNLYPAVYPHFDLYPPVAGQTEAFRLLMVCEPVQYPVFNLYPAVYPNFNLYPAVSGQSEPSKLITVCEPVLYPFFKLYPPVYPYFDLYPAFSARGEQSKLIVVKAAARYPSFNLYPAVYPYFDLWPSVCEPLISNDPTPLVVGRKSNGRLTHSELHAMVTMERLASGISFNQPRKSHEDLHMEVFQDEAVNTPSGNYSQYLAERRRVQTRRETLPRLSQIDSPSRSLRPSLKPSAPSPSRQLPSAVGMGQLAGFEMMTPLIPEEDSLPSVRTPLMRRSSLASRTAYRSPGNADRKYLSAVEERSERLIPPTLSRSSSMVEQNGRIRQAPTIPLPATPAAGRRDSLVSQRVRAYNSGDDVTLSVETLSKFPMPPRAPLPPLPKTPKALDRSKYPFA